MDELSLWLSNELLMRWSLFPPSNVFTSFRYYPLSKAIELTLDGGYAFYVSGEPDNFLQRGTSRLFLEWLKYDNSELNSPCRVLLRKYVCINLQGNDGLEGIVGDYFTIALTTLASLALEGRSLGFGWLSRCEAKLQDGLCKTLITTVRRLMNSSSTSVFTTFTSLPAMESTSLDGFAIMAAVRQPLFDDFACFAAISCLLRALVRKIGHNSGYGLGRTWGQVIVVTQPFASNNIPHYPLEDVLEALIIVHDDRSRFMHAYKQMFSTLPAIQVIPAVVHPAVRIAMNEPQEAFCCIDVCRSVNLAIKDVNIDALAEGITSNVFDLNDPIAQAAFLFDAAHIFGAVMAQYVGDDVVADSSSDDEIIILGSSPGNNSVIVDSSSDDDDVVVIL